MLGEDAGAPGSDFGAGLMRGAVPGVDGVESSADAGPMPGAASVVGAVSGPPLCFGASGRRGPTARRCTTRWGVSGRTGAGAGATPSCAGAAAGAWAEGGEAEGAASGSAAVVDGAGASVRCKGVWLGEGAVSLLPVCDEVAGRS
ncbi:hypothetical protein Stube_58780 [Streptomyces tubercidicus]|uniref:Uncharacterized protein n=1 Tax=Streptomyces tubercidicus TaxID=47759 RepID=A0A640V2S9_9ACTN|nr:hypothetical protein Stube_58780 [Streptomyces tubercidicus]